MTALVRVEESMTPEQVELIKRTICKGATNDELELFLAVCRRTGLDPFARQVYSVERKSKRKDGTWETTRTTQISIDGFRLIADRSGRYGGQDGPYWCGPDGEWREVWLDAKPPSAAKVGVIRLDWRQTLWAVARWSSYAQTYQDGNPSGMWAKMPDLMLAKVAECLALRRAFPAELSGLYAPEEMGQADHVEPIEGEVLPAEPKQLPAPQREVPVEKCRSCSAPIWWGKTDAGKRNPYDVVDGKATQTSHFSTCPDAKDWSKPRQPASSVPAKIAEHLKPPTDWTEHDRVMMTKGECRACHADSELHVATRLCIDSEACKGRAAAIKQPPAIGQITLGGDVVAPVPDPVEPDLDEAHIAEADDDDDGLDRALVGAFEQEARARQGLRYPGTVKDERDRFLRDCEAIGMVESERARVLGMSVYDWLKSKDGRTLDEAWGLLKAAADRGTVE